MSKPCGIVHSSEIDDYTPKMITCPYCDKENHLINGVKYDEKNYENIKDYFKQNEFAKCEIICDNCMKRFYVKRRYNIIYSYTWGDWEMLQQYECSRGEKVE